jgi:hypothetical protein
MSYDVVWGIQFKELRSAGFRPLTDQAWAGVHTQFDLDALRGRAQKMGLKVMVPITRGEVSGRFKYTCDLSMLQGRDLGFRWTFVPFNDLTAEEKTTKNDRIDPSRRFGYGIFPDETAAVAWKLIVG